MGRKSTIKRLPAEIRQEIDRLLREERTIDEILTHLRTLGKDMSRSSLGRYAQDYRKVGERMRELKEVAAGFAQELGVAEEAKEHRALVQMVHAMLTRFNMTELNRDEPTVEAKDIMFLTKALNEIMGSIGKREDAGAKAVKKMQAEQSKKLDQVARRMGLSEAARDEIRGYIMPDIA